MHFSLYLSLSFLQWKLLSGLEKFILRDFGKAKCILSYGIYLFWHFFRVSVFKVLLFKTFLQLLELHHISFPVVHKTSKAYQVWPMIKEGGSVLNNTYTTFDLLYLVGKRKKRRKHKKGKNPPLFLVSRTISFLHPFCTHRFSKTGQKNGLEQIEKSFN